MADNPFYVAPPNPLAALLAGGQAYQQGQDRQRDERNELAKLLMLKEDRVFRREESERAQGNSDRSFQLQTEETKRSQQNADRQFRLQRDTAIRQNATPEETASQRAAAARSNGIDPTTPEGRAYILNGKLPEPSQDIKFAATIEQRKHAAISNGLDPSSPGFQSFVLTGKMPREDAQPLTATDKKAILEADEMVQSTQAAISNLQKAKELSKQAFAGPMAGTRGYAASFLGESSDTGRSGVATTDLNNLVTTNALGQLKAIFGGAPTEGERKILLDIQGSANQPDAVRQKIYDRAIELADKRLGFNKQRADQLRGGQFYKPEGSMSRAPIKQKQGISQEQYNALAPGSIFIAPDGSERVKP